MNLKNLSLSVLVLGLLAGVVAWFNRPIPPVETDPRVGHPLLDATSANAATGLTVVTNGTTIELTATDGTWRVPSFHDLPADLDKLRRFMRELTEAKVDRVVTRNAERMNRLDFGAHTITLTGLSGPLATIDLGKNAERGGRYVRFDSSANAVAYLTQLSTYLDASPKSWADSKMLHLSPKDVASVSLSFESGAPVTATRENVDAAWTSPTKPDGQDVNVSRVNSLLTTLTGLRFIDTAATAAPDAVDAATHARTATLTSFDGSVVTIALGRRPEKVAPKPTEPSPAPTTTTTAAATGTETETDSAQPTEPTTETTPAGPVFAKLIGSSVAAPLTAADLAFKVSDYVFTGLPKSPAELFVTTPPPTTSTAVEPPTP